MTSIEQLDPVIAKDLEILAMEGSQDDFKDALLRASKAIRTAYFGMGGAKFMMFEDKKGDSYLRLQRMDEWQIHSHHLVDAFFKEVARNGEEYEVIGGGDVSLTRDDGKSTFRFGPGGRQDYNHDKLRKLLDEKLDRRVRYELR